MTDPDDRPTHAGAVVIRSDDAVEILVVSSSDHSAWVLPKGHIEPGEAPEQTVLRELREEAGVVGEIIQPLSARRFRTSDELVVVRYFLIRHCGATEATEVRTLRWLSVPAALELLTFADARSAVVEAVAVADNHRERN